MKSTNPTVRRSTGVDAAAVLSAGLLSSVISIPTSILIARAIGPAGKGAVTLVVTVIAYTTTLCALGVDVALIRFGGNREGSRRDLAGAALGLGLPLGALAGVAALVLFLTVYHQRLPGGLLTWALVIAALGPIAMVTQFLASLITGTGRLLEMSAVTLALQVLAIVGAVIVLVAHLGTGGVLATVAISTIANALLVLILARRAGLFPPVPLYERAKTGELLNFGLRIYAGSLLQGINYRLDVFLIAIFLPLAQVGLYSVGVALGELLWVVPNALSVMLLQRAASLSPSEASRVTQGVTRLTSALLLIGIASMALLARPMVRILFGDSFDASVAPLLLLLPGIWALGLWKNIASDLAGRGRPGVKSVSAGVAAAVTVVLDLVLIPRIGIRGAAIASSCAYTTSFLLAVRAYRRFNGVGFVALAVPRWGDVSVLISMIKLRRENARQEGGRT